MLQLQGLTKKFNDQIALQELSLEIPEGSTQALIGTSGSGKSTLLRIILGLIPPDSGNILLGGIPLSRLPKIEWAARLGYVPQEGGLFPHLTAHENIALVARLRKWPEKKLKDRIEELRNILNLETELLTHYPSELSGGQRQRISLARATLLNPDVLLLDEPMGALDPLIRFGLQGELRTIFRKLGKTVIFVTHDLSEAAFFGDQITLLHQGRILQSGSLSDFLNHPADPFVTRFVGAQRRFPLATGEV